MAQGTDVEIGGQGYMLLPGGYKRIGEGVAAAERTGRASVRRFGGGQRQALAEAGERAWDAKGVGPALLGQGVEPWPGEGIQTDAALAGNAPDATVRAYSAIAGANAYVGIGRYLYRTVQLAAAAWADLVQVADFGLGAAISGIANYGDDLLVLLGSGVDIKKFSVGGAAVSTWRTGERGTVGIGYLGQLVYCPGSPTPDRLKLSLTRYNGNAVTAERWVDAPIVNMGFFGGRVAIATRRSLYLMGGQPDPGQADDPAISGDQSKPTLWQGDPEPIFSHGTWGAADDFVFLLAFGGRLYTWLANRVVSWGGAGDGWRREAIEGASCWGACVAGGFLVVAISGRTGEQEVWATDGDGWWRIHQAASATPRLWPIALGGAGGRDALVFRAGSTTYDLFRLVWRSTSLHTYQPNGSWTSSLLDAGDREAVKSWRAVGASFAAPAPRGNAASVDPVTLTLDSSIDGGATWATAATATPAGGNLRTLDLEGALPAATRSRWIQLRVSWSGVLDWAPALAGVWADYALVPAGAPRRRWELAVRCGDGQVRRDGSVQARTGRQLSADLWAAWMSGTTLTFRDVDFDATGLTHAVRVTAIREEPARPSDGGRWGESVVRLGLVEV